ncbi:hypothetical protein DTL42_07390 [Bremerella cremea]|uniref:Uncharacterized protein n=1 Tax=Bremerella cremea TaxID=1031537 RepID=A0A368KSM9_9BACT|nr:hypothetical protein [Bremerella cremea]RCS52655.1 hypothetical protein DTL42_07390 [Bremerella cremea]
MMARRLLTITIVLAWSLTALPTQKLLAAENLPDLRGVPMIVYGLGSPQMVYSHHQISNMVKRLCGLSGNRLQETTMLAEPKVDYSTLSPCGPMFIEEEETRLGFTP